MPGGQNEEAINRLFTKRFHEDIGDGRGVVISLAFGASK
jgi:hypothetical protein